MHNNRKKRLPIVIAAAVVVALLAVTIVMRNRTPPVPGDEQATKAGTATAANDDLVAGNAPRGSRTRLSRTREDAMREARELSQRRSASKTRSAERAEALKTRVAAQFGAEKVDPAWAPGKESSLQDISKLPQIASNIAEPLRVNVDCRSSMCRIESSFKRSGDAEDWTMLYMASVGSSLPNAVVSRVQNPDGTTSVQIYGKAR